MTARDFQSSLPSGVARRLFAAAALGVTGAHWGTMVYRGTKLTAGQEAALQAALLALAGKCRTLSNPTP